MFAFDSNVRAASSQPQILIEIISNLQPKLCAVDEKKNKLLWQNS